jgi:hypothetical protein
MPTAGTRWIGEVGVEITEVGPRNMAGQISISLRR